MRLLNFRGGFATNSSSSHSLIFMPGGARAETIPSCADGYGWEWFRLVTKGDKRDYLAATLALSLRDQGVSADVIRDVVAAWSNPDAVEKYVDHQSVLTIPRARHGVGYDREFFQALRSFVDRDDVAILGGNDNSTHAEDGQQDNDVRGSAPVTLGLPLEDSAPHWARYDTKRDVWTVFNLHTGGKATVSMSRNPVAKDMKADKPELVDVKATGYCTYGCAQCYQSSTPDGKHAKMYDLWSLADVLGKWKVFEVALGGGEPTLYKSVGQDGHVEHPDAYDDFIDILRRFRDQGVLPNFTTKNLGWLRDEEARPQILEYIGAFAYSVNNRKFSDLLALVDKHDVPKHKVSVNYVVGLENDAWALPFLLNDAAKADIRVTLLGYKEVGFGKTNKPKALPKAGAWLEIVTKAKKEHYDLKVSIDTALVRSTGAKALEKAGIGDWCFSGEEGKVSMYVDAVEMTASKSSYETDEAAKLEAGDELEGSLSRAWEAM